MKKKFSDNLFDTNEYRSMVRWFSPSVLFKTLEKVLPSTIFAKYADGRLVHAALNAIVPETVIEVCCGGEKGVCNKGPGEEIWLDYVADIGDGFDSTYSIAYLIGQEHLEVDGHTLPRADCLIMGGDEVYPDASREDYHYRMQQPYRSAFPNSSLPDAKHPPVYLIPGNHDWYDGLQLFSAIFCSGHDNSLGSWVAHQRRSYFATHLGNNWWVWGFDSQLDEDVDGPQSDYFDTVAKAMDPGAKVILCSSVPTWLHAKIDPGNEEAADRFYRAVHFIANKITSCRDAKIPLMLSGDTHHYNRYVAERVGTNFITAGGGGAFLHPTHKILDDEFTIKWLGGADTKLVIGKDSGTPGRKSIYPDPEVSQKLALGNWKFSFLNWDFSLFLGTLYLICTHLILKCTAYADLPLNGGFLSRLSLSLEVLILKPVFLITAALFIVVLIRSAERKRPVRPYMAIIHALLHCSLILLSASIIGTTLSYVQAESMPKVGDFLYLLLLGLGMAVTGFLGSALWGVYLIVVSYFWGAEANNAFSAMRLDSYKNFLRLKLEADKITVYPIKIDEMPSRKEWVKDPTRTGDRMNQNMPIIVPKSNRRSIGQGFIEKPFEINLGQILSGGNKRD